MTHPFGPQAPLLKQQKAGSSIWKNEIHSEPSPINGFSLVNSVNNFQKIIASCAFTGAPLINEHLSHEEGLSVANDFLREVVIKKKNVFLIGNGGSAAIASHIANDFCNTASLSAFTFNDAALLTCFTNDYGYKNAYALMLSRIAKPGDLLFAISSSGRSKNILYAVDQAYDLGVKVITLSGFFKNNALCKRGQLNIWLDSEEYGMVETGHLFVLHYIADQFGIERSQLNAN